MTKNQRILRLIPLLLWCGLQAVAQEPELFTAMKKKYPDQQAVYLSRTRTVSFFYKGDSLQAQEVFEEELLILKNVTENFIRSKVYGSGLTPVSGIVAKTLVWDGRKYREQEVKSFQKTSEADEGVFFEKTLPLVLCIFCHPKPVFWLLCPKQVLSLNHTLYSE
ncbi:MAG: hypothetical protein ACKO96_21565 [Flammeovirgaceae bacterium]